MSVLHRDSGCQEVFIGLPLHGACVQNVHTHTRRQRVTAGEVLAVHRSRGLCWRLPFSTARPANDKAQGSSNSVPCNRAAYGSPGSPPAPGHSTGTGATGARPEPCAAYLEARGPVNQVEVQVVQLQVAERLLAGSLHHALLMVRAPQLKPAREHILHRAQDAASRPGAHPPLTGML